MESGIVFDIIRIGLMVAVLSLLLAAAFHLGDEDERKYKVIHETREEVIITDGEDVITIEKETKEGNEE